MIRGLVIGDTHCGNLTGLTPPGRWDSENRAWLEPFWNFFNSVVDQIGPVDFMVGNGDLIDGPGKKETTHHITTDLNKQVDMAVQIMEYPKAKKKYIVRGTGFHVEFGGSLESFVADALGIDALDDLRLEVAGRKFHFRHVVGRSDIPYGQYTQVGKELVNDLLQGEMEGYQAADVLIRSHVHYCTGVWLADSMRGYTRQAFTCPALQLRGPVGSGFVRGLRTWKYDVGVTLIEVDRKTKEVFIRPFIFPQKNYMTREYECLIV